MFSAEHLLVVPASKYESHKTPGVVVKAAVSVPSEKLMEVNSPQSALQNRVAVEEDAPTTIAYILNRKPRQDFLEHAHLPISLQIDQTIKPIRTMTRIGQGIGATSEFQGANVRVYPSDSRAGPNLRMLTGLRSHAIQSLSVA